MSGFTDAIEVNHIPASGRFELRQDVAYDIGWEGSGHTIVIPRGFQTDFASIPWFAQWAVPKLGLHTGPALLHDWLYFQTPCSRIMADAIFYEAMLVAGVPFWRRWTIWASVGLFGWMFYNGKTPGEGVGP